MFVPIALFGWVPLNILVLRLLPEQCSTVGLTEGESHRIEDAKKSTYRKVGDLSSKIAFGFGGNGHYTNG